MKPVFQKLTASPDEGFAFKVLRGRSFDCPWHFHDEYELILVLESGGYRLVGDHLAPLRPGDLVLIGPNLPHIYNNDEGSPGRVPRVHALLIQFEPDCFGKQWLELPAMAPVRRLLERARLGLHFYGQTRDRVAGLMQQMAKADGLRRIVTFLNILEILATSRHWRTLASREFAVSGTLYDHERMNRVCDFIRQHLDQPLSRPEAARLVNLSEGAFSRFFRLHTGRTFRQFVNELRVGRACRLLAEGEMNITEIAFACGFGNLSNFNRQFRRFKQTTPRAFRRAILSHALKSWSVDKAGQRG
ncbi:MAG: AraC family transcriptional regulator [Verrucomicrobiae bacterium]|nr:AraC family transcriptional regulator [Verrucomicrobiae bacterium]